MFGGRTEMESGTGTRTMTSRNLFEDDGEEDGFKDELTDEDTSATQTKYSQINKNLQGIISFCASKLGAHPFPHHVTHSHPHSHHRERHGQDHFDEDFPESLVEGDAGRSPGQGHWSYQLSDCHPEEPVEKIHNKSGEGYMKYHKRENQKREERLNSEQRGCEDCSTRGPGSFGGKFMMGKRERTTSSGGGGPDDGSTAPLSFSRRLQIREEEAAAASASAAVTRDMTDMAVRAWIRPPEMQPERSLQRSLLAKLQNFSSSPFMPLKCPKCQLEISKRELDTMSKKLSRVQGCHNCDSVCCGSVYGSGSGSTGHMHGHSHSHGHGHGHGQTHVLNHGQSHGQSHGQWHGHWHGGMGVVSAGGRAMRRHLCGGDDDEAAAAAVASGKEWACTCGQSAAVRERSRLLHKQVHLQPQEPRVLESSRTLPTSRFVSRSDCIATPPTPNATPNNSPGHHALHHSLNQSLFQCGGLVGAGGCHHADNNGNNVNMHKVAPNFVRHEDTHGKCRDCYRQDMLHDAFKLKHVIDAQYDRQKTAPFSHGKRVHHQSGGPSNTGNGGGGKTEAETPTTTPADGVCEGGCGRRNGKEGSEATPAGTSDRIAGGGSEDAGESGDSDVGGDRNLGGDKDLGGGRNLGGARRSNKAPEKMRAQNSEDDLVVDLDSSSSIGSETVLVDNDHPPTPCTSASVSASPSTPSLDE